MKIKRFLNSEAAAQFVKYVVCGLATVAFYVGGVWLISGLTNFPDLWVNSIFYVFATVFGYLLNYFWSFQSDSDHTKSFLKYLIVAAVGIGLNYFAVKYMTMGLGFSLAIAALVFAALWPIFSFVAQKFFVYRG